MLLTLVATLVLRGPDTIAYDPRLRRFRTGDKFYQRVETSPTKLDRVIGRTPEVHTWLTKIRVTGSEGKWNLLEVVSGPVDSSDQFKLKYTVIHHLRQENETREVRFDGSKMADESTFDANGNISRPGETMSAGWIDERTTKAWGFPTRPGSESRPFRCEYVRDLKLNWDGMEIVVKEFRQTSYDGKAIMIDWINPRTGFPIKHSLQLEGGTDDPVVTDWLLSSRGIKID